MKMIKLISLLLVLATVCYSADPTNYQEYTGGGIHSGLDANSAQFKLNGKPFRILSGSLHYFRLPWQYWKDRLDKFKAAGLNTVSITRCLVKYILMKFYSKLLIVWNQCI